MNSSLILVTYLAIFAFIAVVLIHLIVYRYARTKVRCENCGSERLRFLELSAITSTDSQADYSIYICADCENKIYKKIR